MKNVLITGCSRGIGFETARLMVEKGYRVMAVSRNNDGLNALVEVVDSASGALLIHTADLTDTESLAARVKEELGKVDILINNAARFSRKEFGAWTSEDWEDIYRVNVIAPTLLIQELRDVFTSGAHVINISSVGGLGGSMKFKGLMAYSSSKAALNIITECLALEMEEKEVYCNALALGSSETTMFKSAFPGQKAASSPSEMAEFIVDFALNGAPLINGKVLPVSSTNP